jgi:hypothetical protein
VKAASKMRLNALIARLSLTHSLCVREMKLSASLSTFHLAPSE